MQIPYQNYRNRIGAHQSCLSTVRVADEAVFASETSDIFVVYNTKVFVYQQKKGYCIALLGDGLECAKL